MKQAEAAQTLSETLRRVQNFCIGNVAVVCQMEIFINNHRDVKAEKSIEWNFI